MVKTSQQLVAVGWCFPVVGNQLQRVDESLVGFTRPAEHGRKRWLIGDHIGLVEPTFLDDSPQIASGLLGGGIKQAVYTNAIRRWYEIEGRSGDDGGMSVPGGGHVEQIAPPRT